MTVGRVPSESAQSRNPSSLRSFMAKLQGLHRSRGMESQQSPCQNTGGLALSGGWWLRTGARIGRNAKGRHIPQDSPLQRLVYLGFDDNDLGRGAGAQG